MGMFKMRNKAKHIKNINSYIENRFLKNEIYLNDLIAVANIPQFELLILSCDVNCILDNYEFNPIKQSFVLRELCKWSIIDDMNEYFLVDNETVGLLANNKCYSLVLSYDELIKCSLSQMPETWLNAIRQVEQP
jgi:hypothetical protein